MHNRFEAPFRTIEAKNSPEFFNNVGLVGLDMDDTTVEHNPQDLVLKFASAVLYSRLPDRINPSGYVAAQTTKEDADAYAVALSMHAPDAFGLEPADFLVQTRAWVDATLDHTTRDRIVVETFGFKDVGEFWDEYGKFNKLVPREAADYTTFTPGSEEFLKFLFARRDSHGTPVYIISNSQHDRLAPRLEYIRNAGFPEFDGVVSSRSDFGVRKPAPDALLHVGQRVTLPEGAEKIYIGNGSEDIQAAVAAGWTPVIINTKQDEFVEGVEYFHFDSMASFHSYWQQQVQKGEQ